MTKVFNLRKELQRRMTLQRLSAADLVRQTGIAKQVISDWLAGAMPRNITQVKTVADVFGVTVDELCFGGGLAEDQKADGFHRGPWITGIFEGRVRQVRIGVVEEVGESGGEAAEGSAGGGEADGDGDGE